MRWRDWIEENQQNCVLAPCLWSNHWLQFSLQLQTSYYQTLPSITSAVGENNTCAYLISTIVWYSGKYPDTARISLHQCDEALGLGQSNWLTSQQHVSHGCGETHRCTVVSTVRMEEWPSGKEMYLWHPSGARLQLLVCRPAPSSPLLFHLHFSACTSQRGHGDSGEKPSWPCILIQSGSSLRKVGLRLRCWEKKIVKGTPEDGKRFCWVQTMHSPIFVGAQQAAPSGWYFPDLETCFSRIQHVVHRWEESMGFN